MEKEQIFTTIKQELGQTSLSDRTIETFASKLQVPEDLSAHSDFFAKQVDILKTLDGQLSHDVSIKVEDFKKTYKPANVEPQPTEKKDDDNVSSALAAKLEAIEAKLEAAEKEKEMLKAKTIKDNIMSDAFNLSKEKGAENETVLKLIKPLISINDDDTKETLSAKIIAEYNKNYKELYGDGAAPLSSNKDSEASKKRELEETKKHLIAAGKIKEKTT